MQKTNTRYHDIEAIAAARDRAKNKQLRMRRTATLAAIYEMAKDPTLEMMRRKLIDAVKRNDHMQIIRIKQRIEAYTSTESFRSHLAHAVARQTNYTEARRFYYKV